VNTQKLPGITRRLLEQLSVQPAIQHFKLAGGTALCLRHCHRISEDLDFAYTSSALLPRREIQGLIKGLSGQFDSCEQKVDLARASDFENDGLNLDDYQQDYEIHAGTEKTRLTFWVPEHRTAFEGAAVDRFGMVSVVGDQTIFASKALVLAERIRSRDVFDLWYLISKAGCTMDHFEQAFVEAFGKDQYAQNFETALIRVMRQPYAPSDPGYTGTEAGMPDPDAARALLWAKIENWLKTQARHALADQLRLGASGRPL
jgi:predicted nucleotidyltransferase component of viral defense system